MTRRAEHDVGVEPFAPQVEIAVFEADFLGIFGLASNRHRQFGGGRLDLDRVGDQLDIAGGKLGVDRPALTRDDLAGDGHNRLDTQPVENVQRLAPGTGNDLGQAVMIAQIDEQHAAMIALAVDPARQARGRVDIGGAQVGASVGAIGVHGFAHWFVIQGLTRDPPSSAQERSGRPRLKAGVTGKKIRRGAFPPPLLLSRQPSPAMAAPT